MRTPSLLLMSLLAVLAGCQPEAAAPQNSAVPVAAAPAVATVEPMTQPVASEVAPSAAAEKSASSSGERAVPVAPQKAAPAAKPTPVAVAKPASAAPVPTTVVAEVKPAAAPSEADALALAKKSGCLVCHAVDRKIVGPAWKDVAAKYRGDAGAEARLMNKIAKGGSGVWGSMAMPPQSKLSESDRQALAHFVLSLK